MTHVPSLELNGRFYLRAVRPLLGATPHAATLLGWGSDVLGYDTERSTDHGYGPRLQIFLDAADVERVSGLVAAGLPESFEGWPVRYGWDAVPVTHHVTVTTVVAWTTELLGFAPQAPLGAVDWLVTPQQKLLEVTRGRVYVDDLGEVTAVREALNFYPDQVWRWLLACQWQRIAEEEAFVGRTAEVGDELGSRLITARLVRDVVRLALLIGRRYAPYSKWLGTAFRELWDGDGLADTLAAALTDGGEVRQERLAGAYRLLAIRCNDLGLAEPLDPSPRAFHGRPYSVLMAERFADALAATVTDPELTPLPLVGAVDQWVDNTLVTEVGARARDVRAWYVTLAAGAPAEAFPTQPVGQRKPASSELDTPSNGEPGEGE